jgi:hypothetical protein
MKTASMTTQICLPPGLPSGELMYSFLRSVLEEYRWFTPMRWGDAFLDRKFESQGVDYSALVAFYEDTKTLCVAARTDRDFFLLHPSKPDVPPYTGVLDWVTSTHRANNPSWRAEHVRQVTALMRLLNAPLAYAASKDELDLRTRRLVPNPDGFGQTETYTLRDYSEGLEGLFWRNFYGPLFVQLFGDRLSSLPGEFKQDLGDDIVLVQPYELPTQAGTPEAVERERQLIAQLGPECFYDHERHLKPTRVPDLPATWLH